MAHDTELTGSMLSLPHCNVFCTPMYKGTQLSVAFFATCAGYLGLLEKCFKKKLSLSHVMKHLRVSSQSYNLSNISKCSIISCNVYNSA